MTTTEPLDEEPAGRIPPNAPAAGMPTTGPRTPSGVSSAYTLLAAEADEIADLHAEAITKRVGWLAREVKQVRAELERTEGAS